jgi:hypothetical protein
MTTAGALWFVKEQMSFVSGLEQGLEQFRKVYGSDPQEIEINPIHFDKDGAYYKIKTVQGIPIVENKGIMKRNIFYGYGDDTLVLIEMKNRTLRKE